MGERIVSFNADTLKSCPVIAAAWAALLKHQWCIVAVCSASLFLMDVLQAVKGKGAGNAGNWRMFVSPQNSYIENLIFNVTAFIHGTFGR